MFSSSTQTQAHRERELLIETERERAWETRNEQIDDVKWVRDKRSKF